MRLSRLLFFSFFFLLPQRFYFFLAGVKKLWKSGFLKVWKSKAKNKRKNAIFTRRFIIPLLIFRLLAIRLISELTEYWSREVQTHNDRCMWPSIGSEVNAAAPKWQQNIILSLRWWCISKWSPSTHVGKSRCSEFLGFYWMLMWDVMFLFSFSYQEDSQGAQCLWLQTWGLLKWAGGQAISAPG